MEDQPISVTSSCSNDVSQTPNGHCSICGSFTDQEPCEPSLIALLYSSVLKIQLDSDLDSILQKFCPNCSATLKELGEVEGQIRSLTGLLTDLQEKLLTAVISQLVKTCVDIGLRSNVVSENNDRQKMGKYAKMLGSTSTGYRVYKKWRSKFTTSFLTRFKNSKPETDDPKSQIDDVNPEPEVTKFCMDHDYSAVVSAMDMDKISESHPPASNSQVERSEAAAFANYPCPECDRSFSRKVSLEAHVKKSHIANHNAFDEPASVCPICRIQCETEETMQNHIQLKHPEVRCEKCDRCSTLYTVPTTGDADALLTHHECLKSETEEDSRATCSLKTSISSKFKKKYMRRKPETAKIKSTDVQGRQPRKFDCTNCNKQFTTRTQLSIHSKIHSGEKPFICETCGQQFSSLASIHSHRKTHAGIRPHKCETCGKFFRSVGHLAKHAIIHSGLKPFSCTVCEKSFNRRENLKAHQQTHEQVRPFQCPKCPSKAFTRPSLLRNHEIEFHSHLSTPAPTPASVPVPSPAPAPDEQIIQCEDLSNLQLQPLEIIQDPAALVGSVLSYVQEAVILSEDGGQYIIFNQVQNM